MRPKEIALTSLSTIGLYFILTGCFSVETKKKIWARDGGRSVNSGRTENLECAHYDHTKGTPIYDDPNNGRLLTRREHYLEHFHRRNNGLTFENNRWTLSAIWKRMTPGEKRGLPEPKEYKRLPVSKSQPAAAVR